LSNARQSSLLPENLNWVPRLGPPSIFEQFLSGFYVLGEKKKKLHNLALKDTKYLMKMPAKNIFSQNFQPNPKPGTRFLSVVGSLLAWSV